METEQNRATCLQSAKLVQLLSQLHFLGCFLKFRQRNREQIVEKDVGQARLLRLQWSPLALVFLDLSLL